jgi:two-component system sensor histidine kinase HydH
MGREKPLWDGCPFELFDLTSLSELGLEGWLTSLLGHGLAYFKAESGSIFLVGPDGLARLAAQAGSEPRLPEDVSIRAGEGVGGAVLARGGAMVVNDPGSDPFFAGVRMRARRPVGSALVVPLVDVTGSRVGLLNVSRAAGAQPFDQRELRSSEVFGQFMAMAVLNARLVDSVQAALAEARHREALLHAVLSKVPGRVCVVGKGGSATGLGDPLPKTPRPLAVAASEAAGTLAAGGKKLRKRVEDPSTGRVWTMDGTPLADGGGVLTIHEDTAAVAAQAEAARERHLADLGRMSAAVAHEIRNPLTGISAAAQMVLDDAPDAKEYAAIIQQEALRLESLCESFLSHARPLRLERKPATISEAVSHVVRLVGPVAAERGVRLVVELPRAERERNLDPGRVRQAVLNLVQNAVQASPPGTAVSIRVRRSGIEVEDSGAGIEADVVPRLFTPFFTTKEGGTGLGLSMVQRIAEAHGGDVRIESSPGKGTTVRVDFERRIA